MVTVNNKPYSFDSVETILDLLRRIGIEVPAICPDDRLLPASVWRLCLVKVNGMSRLRPAFSTLVFEDMEIETYTPEIESYRKAVLQWVARGYPYVGIAKNPQKELHKWFLFYGIGEMDGESA
ncbi:MAG: (2Fe-2S)-binding protein [Bacteroidetes bacterium]|nr:(2Fe-2S)-binding protein [Bacteroidota bacterium]